MGSVLKEKGEATTAPSSRGLIAVILISVFADCHVFSNPHRYLYTSIPPPRPTATAISRTLATLIQVWSCCKICSTGKAYGDSCIAKDRNSNQPLECACET
jgi:hypothetical protein